MEECAAQKVIAKTKAQERREIAQKKLADKEEAELQMLLHRRKSRWQRLGETREVRRKKAKTMAIKRFGRRLKA